MRNPSRHASIGLLVFIFRKGSFCGKLAAHANGVDMAQKPKSKQRATTGPITLEVAGASLVFDGRTITVKAPKIVIDSPQISFNAPPNVADHQHFSPIGQQRVRTSGVIYSTAAKKKKLPK